MKITLNNYEAFLLDWSEGNLDYENRIELEKFLLENPKLDIHLKNNTIKILPEKSIYKEKSKLYRFEFEKTTITEYNFNEFCIALYEDLLSDKKREELLYYANTSQEYKKELATFRKVYLEPIEDIKFNDKELLYKKKPVDKKTSISLWGFITAAIAASIIYIMIKVLPIKPEQNIKPSNTTSIIFQPKTMSLPINQLSVANERNEKKRTIKNRITKTEKNINSNLIKEKIELINPITLNTNDLKSEKEWIPKQIEFKNTNPSEAKEITTKNKEYLTWNSILIYTEKGIQKLNKVMGSDIQLSHNEDSNGKIKNIRFKSGAFEYYSQNNN